jgi:hypothetical protein
MLKLPTKQEAARVADQGLTVFLDRVESLSDERILPSRPPNPG